MKIEVSLNTLDDKEWWFNLGLSYDKVHYHEMKHVFTIGVIFFSIYVRW